VTKQGEITRKEIDAATKKAAAWFRDPALVTDPQLVPIDLPRAFVHVGRIVSIVYESDKFDGKAKHYEHEFTKQHELLISPDGRCFVLDPPCKVTTRGIEG
jgi:hypothetical protein